MTSQSAFSPTLVSPAVDLGSTGAQSPTASPVTAAHSPVRKASPVQHRGLRTIKEDPIAEALPLPYMSPNPYTDARRHSLDN